MPDQFKEVLTTSYGGRIAQSFKNILFGLVMFVISFGVLFWNEGRYDLSILAKKSVEINASTVNQSLDNSLIALTSNISTTENINDNLYLKLGNYLAIDRNVESYVWVEKSETKSTNNSGGSQTEETTYTYSKAWTDNPQSSSNFKYIEGHVNPSIIPLEKTQMRVRNATIGIYNIDMQSINLPSLEPLVLSPSNTNLINGASISSSKYIFLSQTGGSFENPSLGDQRISYSALTPGFMGTVFGNQVGSNITSFTDEDGHRLFNLFRGSRGDGIASLHSDFVFWSWIFRLIGFLMMWFGLSLLFGWITMLANILPFLGNVTGFIITAATFITALVLSLTTIIVAMIFHSLIAVLLAVLIVAGILVFLAKRRKNKVATPSIQSMPPTIPLS